jgi:hypothetical protein
VGAFSGVYVLSLITAEEAEPGGGDAEGTARQEIVARIDINLSSSIDILLFSCHIPRDKSIGDEPMETLTSTKPQQQHSVHPKIDREGAIAEANGFIIENLPDRFCAGVPRLVSLPERTVWAVPILLSYPEIGPVGETGIVAVDVEIGAVVGSTPIAEILKAGEQLYAEKKEQIEAAFL